MKRLIFTALILLWASIANATTYYVRTDGLDAHTGTSNTAGGAWLTIDHCMDTVAAGDYCRIQAGTYAEVVTPGVSGTSGNTITLVADGAVTFCGMDLSGTRSYIRVIGFTVDTDAGACTKDNRDFDFNSSGTYTGWEFWNNTITNANACGLCAGDYPPRQNNFILIGNTFSTIGGVGNNGSATSLRGSNNIQCYNDVTPTPDAFQVDGVSNIWCNNYIHGTTDPSDLHADIFQSDSSVLGLSNNLWEANLVIGNGTLANEHGILVQNNGGSGCEGGACGSITENLYRHNIWHNLGGGAHSGNQATVAAMTDFRIVQETIVDMDRTQTSQTYGVYYGGSGVTAWVFNSIFYQVWGSSATSNLEVYLVDTGASIAGADYNLSYDPDGSVTFTTPWSSQAHEINNTSPNFVNAATDDFHLGAGSGDSANARGTGNALTTASGSGTGTTFNVQTNTAGFFRGDNTNISQYSGGLVAGDTITVGTDVVTIASISGDAITTVESFTWVDGDSVYWGSDSTPDIGALPYKTSYTLSATYSCSGTCAIVPNDASLVRFVVCYDSTVPYEVDNSSPYSCATASGTFSAKVYPLYAGSTLSVTATDAGSGNGTAGLGQFLGGRRE